MVAGSAEKSMALFQALPVETRDAYQDPRPKFAEGENIISKTLEVSETRSLSIYIRLFEHPLILYHQSCVIRTRSWWWMPSWPDLQTRRLACGISRGLEPVP
jgi:reverse gyrase